jgi:hypothetical protein
MSELLPCPFCGGIPYKMVGGGFHCRDCHTWQNGAEAWNRRANRWANFETEELSALSTHSPYGHCINRTITPTSAKIAIALINSAESELARRRARGAA